MKSQRRGVKYLVRVKSPKPKLSLQQRTQNLTGGSLESPKGGGGVKSQRRGVKYLVRVKSPKPKLSLQQRTQNLTGGSLESPKGGGGP